MVSAPGFPGAQVSLSLALMVMAAAEALQPFLWGAVAQLPSILLSRV